MNFIEDETNTGHNLMNTRLTVSAGLPGTSRSRVAEDASAE